MAIREDCAGFIRRALAGGAVAAVAFGVDASASGATTPGRHAFGATTTTNTGVVMLALVGGLLVLVGIGSVAFTLARRKKRPVPCAEQRDALVLAEKAVQYWEAVRAHVVAVETERLQVEGADSHDSTHATQLAKAIEGLQSAMKQRDECEMALIRCMASGVPSAPTLTPAPEIQQPFFIPGTDSPPSTPTN